MWDDNRTTAQQGGRSCATARPPVAASAGAPALAGSPSIRAFVAKSVLTRITRYWIHYFQLFSATSTVKMPVFMKNYKFCWQNCKKKTTFMLQKFAMVFLSRKFANTRSALALSGIFGGHR